jgi:ribosomal protein S18 acetylase RimI-like enzyme
MARVNVVVRLARAEDAEPIGALHVRAWHWAYRGLMPERLLAAQDPQKRAEMWRGALTKAGTAQRIWLALAGDELVGFAASGPSRDEDAERDCGELYAIYIEERVVGSGVGKTLARKSLVDLASRGFTRATLWVLDSNERGRRFYEAGGWELDSKEKLDARDGVTLRELRYSIDLDPTV